MNVLFEEFVGEILRRHRSGTLGTEFENCNIHLQARRRWLVEEPRSFRLIPDIILSDGKEIKLIIDTKYKILDREKKHNGISQADIYQMFAYGKKYKCNRIILLYPWVEELGEYKSEGKPYSFERDFRLYVATVNLKRDLKNKKEIEDLIGELSEILNSK
jgi:5-methylcytosine-specific restriction enzyme subunit McrC